ncbi:IS4 family transposase [Stieleria varia]|uniref:Transposase DDE domain protein n=1 Tax=Stieleria varia TaxID=2528005 RepID=A0A5C5ZGC8_9BACT|nr:IS4 family transposase [Stieleria varia]TWT86374.1 hypothetical protein Pla52n_70900 [Stieleria varia]
MSKRDKNTVATQEKRFCRERIACLKRIVGSRFVKSEVRQRNLQKRSSRKCPADVMAWFVIAMWLFGDSAYPKVFRWLHRFVKDRMPSSSALTQARARLGIPIMASIYQKTVCCLCQTSTSGAFYAGMLLVAVDGFVLNLPDSKANRRAFGRPKNGTSMGAFPQARIVALCEIGSHVFFGFLLKPIRCGEVTLAKLVYRYLPPQSLLLFDIGFCTTDLMRQVIDGKSDFLGRCKTNRCFRKDKVLRDGSYLSKIYATDYDRLKDRDGTVVRVIEYTLDDPQRAGHGETHRLITTLLDEAQHPAETLIVLYHERWEEEIAIDEAKTHLRHQPKLRSHSPAGVMQEVYGLLIAHFVIRKLAFEAAKKADVPPNRISFTGTVEVLRVNLAEAPRSPRNFSHWYESLILELSREVLQPRRNRVNPRVIKRPQSKWPKKRDKHRHLPPLKHHFDETIQILT